MEVGFRRVMVDGSGKKLHAKSDGNGHQQMQLSMAHSPGSELSEVTGNFEGCPWMNFVFSFVAQGIWVQFSAFT